MVRFKLISMVFLLLLAGNVFSFYPEAESVKAALEENGYCTYKAFSKDALGISQDSRDNILTLIKVRSKKQKLCRCCNDSNAHINKHKLEYHILLRSESDDSQSVIIYDDNRALITAQNDAIENLAKRMHSLSGFSAAKLKLLFLH